jgi:hypothetical protein
VTNLFPEYGAVAKKRRARVSKPETQQANRDLGDVIRDGDDDELARALGAAIHRLGSEQLREVGNDVLRRLAA